MAKDSMLIEAPAAQLELTLLHGLKVGDRRQGLLLPALSIGVEWICTTVSPDRWTFDGQFFGQPVWRAVIEAQGGRLTLDVQAGGV